MLEVSFLWSMTFIKLSVLIFYRHLFKESSSGRLIYTSWGAICVLVTTSIIVSALVFTTCNPISAYWLRVYPGYGQFTCRTELSIFIINETSVVVNLITDIYSLAIPALLVTQLRLSRRQRIAVMFILGIGSMWVIYLFASTLPDFMILTDIVAPSSPVLCGSGISIEGR
jgi:hypothetical protein